MIAPEMFDGEFMNIAAADIRDRDVILGGARTVTATPETAGDDVTVATTTGTETYRADTPVHVFRPAPACADEPCADCGAGPGEPCGVDCLGYAALDDAAEMLTV
jgi:hypothetical protein